MLLVKAGKGKQVGDFGLEVLVFDGNIGGDGLTRMSFGERKMDGSNNTETRAANDAERKAKKSTGHL